MDELSSPSRGAMDDVSGDLAGSAVGVCQGACELLKPREGVPGVP